MNVRLTAIERDTTIQCRASIDMGVVNDYAQLMDDGTEFPPVVLYGKEDRCWIGDGWHRVMAAEQRGDETIRAELRSGGRTEALKHALGANASHGHRRSNADKRRCVEIALREFAGMSSRAIAGMCGVSHPFVESNRPQQALETVSNATRTTTDGRQYPARRQARDVEEPGPIGPDADDDEIGHAECPPKDNEEDARRRSLLPTNINCAIKLLEGSITTLVVERWTAKQREHAIDRLEAITDVIREGQ